MLAVDIAELTMVSSFYVGRCKIFGTYNRAKMLYLSPLVQDSKNISLSDQKIREYKIAFNIKVPIVYEYADNGDVFIYNRFLTI